jgi:hypothetical protein
MAILANHYGPVADLRNNKHIELLVGDDLRILFKLYGFFKINKEKIDKIFNEFIKAVTWE